MKDDLAFSQIQAQPRYYHEKIESDVMLVCRFNTSVKQSIDPVGSHGRQI